MDVLAELKLWLSKQRDIHASADGKLYSVANKRYSAASNAGKFTAYAATIRQIEALEKGTVKSCAAAGRWRKTTPPQDGSVFLGKWGNLPPQTAYWNFNIERYLDITGAIVSEPDKWAEIDLK